MLTASPAIPAGVFGWQNKDFHIWASWKWIILWGKNCICFPDPRMVVGRRKVRYFSPPWRRISSFVVMKASPSANKLVDKYRGPSVWWMPFKPIICLASGKDDVIQFIVIEVPSTSEGWGLLLPRWPGLKCMGRYCTENSRGNMINNRQCTICPTKGSGSLVSLTPAVDTKSSFSWERAWIKEFSHFHHERKQNAGDVGGVCDQLPSGRPAGVTHQAAHGRVVEY